MSHNMNIQGALKADSLNGKTILITGGGTGLGRAMGAYFLELGANLIITSRKFDVLTLAAREMEDATSGSVLPVACDVRDYQQVDHLLKTGLEKYGKIDGLINNAAGNFISPTERLSANAFSTIIDIVLKGTVNCTLALGKHWIKEKHKASVLNIVTTYASTGSAYVVPSAAAKGGVLSLTKSLAAEWGKYGIRHNAIAPGLFPTKGAWDRLLPGNLAEKFKPQNRVPLNRTGEHQELANLAAFLMSDFAEYINGATITIDGGEWIQGAGQFNDFRHITDEMWDSLEQMIKKTNAD